MEYSDSVLPPVPALLHTYTVDGEQAWTVTEVTRDQDVLWIDDGVPTGHIFRRIVADSAAILGLR